ncbi:MAG: helix-turn-helix domain-containing protein [Halorhabdus sp.]
MIEARFRMQLPADIWIAEISTSYASATFRLLTGAPVGERVLELGEVTASNPEAVSAAIRDHSDVLAYEQLYLEDGTGIAQYETTEQQLYEFLGDSALPPEFPVVVEDGEMEFDVTATREQFETMGTALDASGYEYELLSVVEGRDPETLLTDRQRQCLTVAFREGYFEVPRGCTLEDVADAIGIDKSTASETIRRGSARVLEWFLIGTDLV